MILTSSKFSLIYPIDAWFCAATLLVVLLGSSGCGSKEPVIPAIGEPAPDFTFVDLSTERVRNLTDFKGKVVVIDFWASWCAPCQETMAEMQMYRERHPEWGDSVVFLATSIDDSESAAKSHLEKKGWNKTQNAWVDPKGGKNPDVIAYAGNGIPAGYIIRPDGVLFDAGHPGKMDIAAAVEKLLPARGP